MFSYFITMSLDLNDYFSLGLESTNQPIENAGMLNVFQEPGGHLIYKS
jgi:hypothetical protein